MGQLIYGDDREWGLGELGQCIQCYKKWKCHLKRK